MRKLLASLLGFLISVGAFAQGKVSFQNNSTHLVYWPPGFGLLSGQAVNSDNMPPGIAGLAADLYMGTSSSLLRLYSTASFHLLAEGPGKWNSLNVQANANPTTGAPAIPGGTTTFIEIQVRSTETAAPNVFDPTQAALFQVCFFSAEFNFKLGSSIVYPVLWGANGNWPIGTFPMDQYGVGSLGAIPYVPEPCTGALAGLCVAVLIFRRKSFQKGSTL